MLPREPPTSGSSGPLTAALALVLARVRGGPAGMASLADRFEAKVDRSGEHHVWLGSKKADGTGKLKVGGKTVTAPRVAWKLEHGELAPGQEVSPCAAVKACVRVEHLSLRGQPP